jgi:hypothetical protein
MRLFPLARVPGSMVVLLQCHSPQRFMGVGLVSRRTLLAHFGRYSGSTRGHTRTALPKPIVWHSIVELMRRLCGNRSPVGVRGEAHTTSSFYRSRFTCQPMQHCDCKVEHGDIVLDTVPCTFCGLLFHLEFWIQRRTTVQLQINVLRITNSVPSVLEVQASW